MIKRIFAPTMVFLLGLALGSCAPLAATVTDAWPTWAGGMPKDVPPRPGAPGYAEFMAHQEGKDTPPAEAGPAAGAAPAGANAAAEQGAQPVAPMGYSPAKNEGALHGGLY
jgi:hypothetical protein